MHFGDNELNSGDAIGLNLWCVLLFCSLGNGFFYEINARLSCIFFQEHFQLSYRAAF